jgi:hypothetical protein
MTVRISAIAEVAHDGQSILYLTHKSGAKNQTRYANQAELIQAYRTVQAMLVQHETGKSIEEHETEGTIQKAVGPISPDEHEDYLPMRGLSLVKSPEES